MPRRRAWGSGQVIPPESPGGSWAIRWPESGRRRFRSGFPTQDLARRALEAIRGDLARERVGLPPDARGLPRLEELAAEWLERRRHTHRAWATDRNRWRRDLAPTFGRLRAGDVTQGSIRAWAEERLRAGLAPASVQRGVRLLSTLWSDLCERPRETGALTDPTKRLPRSLRKLLRSTHDPRLTPYLPAAADVERVHAAMPSPERVAFAVGALAGLRTGEILGLSWPSVDLERRQVVVREQVQRGQLGPLKDEEPRIVPLAPALAGELTAYRLKTGGAGLLFPPARPGRRSGPSRRPARFMRPQRLASALAAALEACRLPALTWYQATRHTFASHRVQAGVPLATVGAWLGHSSPLVTQRYAHLAPAGAAAAGAIGLEAPQLGQRTGRVTRHPAADAAGKRKRKR